MEKWLLDTDIGSDKDDCMALGYLLAHDDIELLGVTTTCGQCYERAQLANAMCLQTGKNIPVYRGNETSLLGLNLQNSMETYQHEQISRYPVGEILQDNCAVEFMRRIILENPNQITLASIGPMTNAALLLAAHPEVFGLLKSVVIMAGRYIEPERFDYDKWGYQECNIYLDPYAASIVFHHMNVPCYLVGIETTYPFYKTGIEVAKKMSAIPFMKPLADAAQKSSVVWFHDAVAVWAMKNSERMIWHRGNVKIDWDNPKGKITNFETDESGKFMILDAHSTENFFDEYAETLGIIWD